MVTQTIGLAGNAGQLDFQVHERLCLSCVVAAEINSLADLIDTIIQRSTRF